MAGFVAVQVAFDLYDSTASIPSSDKVLEEHYNSLYKETLFQTIEGKKFDLEEITSKTVIVHFWASWCVPCLKEIDLLSKKYKQTSRQDLEIISVNTDEKNAEELVEKIKRKYDISYQVVYDEDTTICKDFRVDQLPFMAIYKNGKFVERVLGFNDKDFEKFLRSI